MSIDNFTFDPARLADDSPTNVPVGEFRRVLVEVQRCSDAARLAALDKDRLEIFGRHPVWCMDFSEVLAYVENEERHGQALLLMDLLLFGPHKAHRVVLLPGTLFEMLSYIDKLLRRNARLGGLSFDTDGVKQRIDRNANPEQVADMMVRFVSERMGKQVQRALQLLGTTEPAATRLQHLLRSTRVRYLHRELSHKEMFAFPGQFLRFFSDLASRRDRMSVNNYNDALNVTLCLAANSTHNPESYYVYVTRDKVCMEVAQAHPWLNDPVRKAAPTENVPLVRTPYSALLFMGDVDDPSVDRSLELHRMCRDFVESASRLPEYRNLLRTEPNNSRVRIHISPRSNQHHNMFSESLAGLLRSHGVLVFRAMAESDGRLDTRRWISDYPKARRADPVRSLERLTAALGLVYEEISQEAAGARAYVQRIERFQGGDPLELISDHDEEFGCTSVVVRSTVGRLATVFFADMYADYYSAWWPSAVSLDAFLDVVDFFWSHAQAEQTKLTVMRGAVSANQDEKVFPSGFTVAHRVIEDGKLSFRLDTRTVDGVAPLSQDTIDLLRTEVDEHDAFSLRINTTVGDFWYNLSLGPQSGGRMGVISHLWMPGTIARAVAVTNQHHCTSGPLEELLQSQVQSEPTSREG